MMMNYEMSDRLCNLVCGSRRGVVGQAKIYIDMLDRQQKMDRGCVIRVLNARVEDGVYAVSVWQHQGVSGVNGRSRW